MWFEPFRHCAQCYSACELYTLSVLTVSFMSFSLMNSCHLEQTVQKFSLFAQCSVVGLCISFHLLQEEASLMRAEQDTSMDKAECYQESFFFPLCSLHNNSVWFSPKAHGVSSFRFLATRAMSCMGTISSRMAGYFIIFIQPLSQHILSPPQTVGFSAEVVFYLFPLVVQSTSLQGKRLQLDTTSASLCSMRKVSSICSNKALPSICKGQSIALAKAYDIGGFPQGPLAKLNQI